VPVVVVVVDGVGQNAGLLLRIDGKHKAVSAVGKEVNEQKKLAEEREKILEIQVGCACVCVCVCGLISSRSC
jgi:hypothetical protein